MVDYKSPRGRDGLRKANTFASFAAEFGWQCKVNQNGLEVKLFARRGTSETLDFIWIDGSWSDCCFYTLAGERIKCHNLSAASRIVQEKPDPKRLTKATQKRKRQTGIDYTTNHVFSEDDLLAARGSLPFDSESSDDEIEAVLHRKSITWLNTISGQVYSAFVDADRQFAIVRKNCNEKIKADYITFSTKFGYRAVYLHSIVAVVGR